MTEEERALLATAEQKISEALGALMDHRIESIPAIRDARQKVVDAQNAVNRLVSGERTA